MWSDLPVAGGAVRWIDVETALDGWNVYLGTDQGLYQSNDKGIRWERREAGLPAGQLGEWLRTKEFCIATLREGGMYMSQDGRTWERVDHDAERGRFSGLVETEPGVLSVGSESEGMLLLTVKERK